LRIFGVLGEDASMTPFLVAGRSIGGVIARRFKARHPGAVVRRFRARAGLAA
jgi:pimeloyl-ACP methyl ester carboxylesterase